MKLSIVLFLFGCSTASTAQTTGRVLISSNCANPTTDTPVWSENVKIDLAKGETRCLLIQNQSAGSVCLQNASASPGAPAVTTSLLQPAPMQQTTSLLQPAPMQQTTSTQSGSSPTTSPYLDVLKQNSAGCVTAGQTQLLDVDASTISASGSTTIKVGNSSISVNVLNVTMPSVPTIPLMVAAVNSMCIRAMSNGKYVPKEKACTEALAATYLSHRITPYASEVVVPPVKNGFLDLDSNGFPGMTAKDTWIKNAHPNFINIPNPNLGGNISVDYLKAAEATIKAQGWAGKAWIYAKDEPNSDAELALTKQILQNIRINAPSLKTMVTMKPKSDFNSLVDYYVTNNVFEPFSVPPNGWIYTACDAHGCGSGDRRNGQAVSLGKGASRPDYGSLDAAGAFTRSFAWSLFKFGAKAGLYYQTMEWTNLIPGIDYLKDQRNFGSHGDGALIFPQADGSTNVSVRLKLIRESMFDLEYLLQMNADERKVFDGIFTSNTVFSKDYGAYQSLIDRIRLRLSGVLPIPTATPIPQPTIGPSPMPTVIPFPFKCRQINKDGGFTLECLAG